MNFELLCYIIWVLAPLIPAFLMFRFLPSDATGSGPLGGLTFKFGGAFAGYLAVLLITRNPIEHIIDTRGAEKWVVTGNIHLKPGGDLKHVKLAVCPPGPPLDDSGHFSLELLREAKGMDLNQEPQLVVSYPSLDPVGVPLKPGNGVSSAYNQINWEVTVDEKDRHITIGKPIIIGDSLNIPAPYTPKLPAQ